MRNRNVGARQIAAPSLPEFDTRPAYEWMSEDLVDELTADPAFTEICRALACAKYLDLDLTDPAVADDAIAAGRRRHAESGDPAYKPRPSKGIHEPVVYYMAVGDSIKIGTTQNIVTRWSNLTRPRIVAVEWGGVEEEGQRHQFFASLSLGGEWFKNQDPLTTHMALVAEAFEADFGCDLRTWIRQLKNGSRYG